MNGRQLIHLSLMAALAPAGQVHAAPRPHKGAGGSAKKGLSIGGKSPDFKRKLEELRCKWFYTWTGNMPHDTPRGIAYTPMIWKYNANALVNRLEAIHKLYRKPIWITEFAVGDWKAKSPEENQHKPDAVLKFMEDVLPKLNKLDFVERYAWFPAASTSAALSTSALWDADGKLTRLGECYRDS